MKQTVNLSTFMDAFHAYKRYDQFGYNALQLLFDYLEEYEDSADEIERLTDENERLREVLNAVLFAFDNDTATAAQLRKVYATEIAKAQALLT